MSMSTIQEAINHATTSMLMEEAKARAAKVKAAQYKAARDYLVRLKERSV